MKVSEVLKEIKDSRSLGGKKSYITKCDKDEVRVMQAILNDKTYEVDVYEKGKVTPYNPSKSMRSMVSNIIQNATNISSKESEMIMDSYHFTESDARKAIEVSKEFFNTYLNTGRKISFGGREDCNISFYKRRINEYKIKSPVLENRKVVDEIITTVPSYNSIKVDSGCPVWIKNNTNK